ncbi:MAG: MBL fold metallo-hydrolase [Firmicutes bacterium]|jgi:hydroxyacylglutathione hydrolase|nr:MBL fold metallo-hydrolase [Bacillota bacterium]
MIVKRFITNELAANCYVVHSGSDAIVVDPGGESQEVLNYLQEQSLNVIALVNTHGHADHIGGNTWFVKKTGAPVWIHELDAPYLADESLNLARFVGQEFEPMTAGRLLRDGDEIELGGEVITVLHTPGHTPGGISLYWPGHVITGDTLFKESAGRTDLPGGNSAQLGNSLLRLGRLPLDTIVYPGHGESTTIRHEIMLNPFL